jgi:hypothetical protein
MKSVNGRKDMKKETTRLPQTKTWILEMIKKARYNQYAPYDSTDAFKSSYHASLHSVNPNLASNHLRRFYSGDATAVLKAHKDYYKGEIENEWAVSTFSSNFDYMGRVPGVPLANFGPPPAMNAPGQEVPVVSSAKRRRSHASLASVGKGKSEKQMDSSEDAAPDSSSEIDMTGDDTSHKQADTANESRMRIPAASRMHSTNNTDRFKNQLAEADESGKKRFDLMVDQWHARQTDDSTAMPSAVYQRLVDQSIAEEAMVASRPSRRAKRIARAAIADGTYAEDERSAARAMHASMNADR